MIVNKYNHSDWIKQNVISSTLLFNQPDFADLISTTYERTLTWYVVSDQKNILFSFPIIHHQRNASLVTHFFYQAIPLNLQLSDVQFKESWKLLISTLKEDFDSIDFKFAPYVEDISPFLTAGFEQEIRYTSILNLQVFPKYSENVRRSLKKASKHNLNVHVHQYHKEIISEQIQDMLKYGLGKKHALKFPIWFEYLSNQKSTLIFELRDEKHRIGSALYLYDKEQAYLIATMGGQEESGGQAYLYDRAFNHFQEMGLKQVDLLGANIPSVALYKSKLGGELHPYFMVSYRKHKIRAKIQANIKAFAKRMLKSFGFINK